MPYIGTNGIETYYERRGEGWPIVFVHGLGMDYRTWEPQLSEFADEYELLAYDVRGSGETEMGDPSNLSVQTFAEDLRALIEELGIERPILCGHSYGGLIIGEYARRYPDDVAGLVYAEANTRPGDHLTLRLYARSLLVTGAVEKLVADGRMNIETDIGERIVKWIEDVENDYDQSELTADELDMTIEEYVSDAHEEFTRFDEYRFISPAIEDFENLDLHEFDIPVLFMYGEHGAEMYVDMAREFDGETGVVTEEIDGAGHFVSLVNSSAFNRVLAEFVDDVTSDRTGVETHAED